MNLETIKDMENGAIKFVRAQGEYRFCDIDDQHDSLVKEGETATSAGIMLLFGAKEFCIPEEGRWSHTLQIGSTDEDAERLGQLLDRKPL